ncbi:MFS transporter [Actinoalloteichus hymeniacidonis]|uniref:Arabinose efflux permease family protein n=1 Tax=Actinoalloteichus hymeniacidonis TaxID=340345 RepID=A0AAC9MZD3_9PSEU|nr:MFS transporter [Actinoalloteichus hymeniacidonis]AOS63947.1 arabinose efflux permease family protein [Actinoalloteichus hymeniacidonis]MBB5907996.1 MFS family permease [Actinoalloteichus hymeniacidonis]
MTTNAESTKAGVDRVHRRTLRLLFCTQIVAGVGTAIGIAVAVLTLAGLSGSAAIGGMGQTALVAGTALLALPFAQLADRAGRRAALVAGFAIATLGAVLAVVSVHLASWPMLLVALVLFGAGNASALSSRYAAVDLSGPDRRAKDLSWILWATTIGSLIGPNLAAATEPIAEAMGIAGRAGPFALAAVAFAVTASAIGIGLRPDPLLIARQRAVRPAAPRQRGVRGALGVIASSADLRVALAGLALAQCVMVALMSMTPVHLQHGHASLGVVGLLMSLHLGAMYAFSPLVGMAVDRFGARRVLLVGCVMLIASALSYALGGDSQVLVGVALVLLGIGWSCGLVSASALVTAATDADNRPSVQGTSDVTLSIASVVGSIGGGLIVAGTSLTVLALICAVLVALFAGYVLRAGSR